jgi:hypothetical protein
VPQKYGFIKLNFHIQKYTKYRRFCFRPVQ